MISNGLYDKSDKQNKPKNPKPMANKKAATSSINFTPNNILDRNKTNNTRDTMLYNLYFACNILKIGKGAISCFSINAALILNVKAAKLADKVNMPQRKNSLIKKDSFDNWDLINCI
ncbi:hypothetical protein FACS1894182_07140 [Bacteroidia bacterium]|nr:hypothetical protein FACS1894182_07140 [Bacteroidia bacterium]